MSLAPGTGFAVTMTINPTRTRRQSEEGGIHERVWTARRRERMAFPDGAWRSIKSIMEAVGFDYCYDAETMQYLHRATSSF